MKTQAPIRASLVAFLLGPLLAPELACAWDHRSGGGSLSRGAWNPETYTALKAGGYDLNAVSGNEDTADGLYLGLEWGASPSQNLEMGVSLDWVRRRQGTEDVLPIEFPFELPVQGVVDLEGTSTDLIPLGGGLRLRFPTGRFVPFVGAQLTYDILRLEYHEVMFVGDTRTVSRHDDYFHGFGTTVSGGLELRLDPRLGVLLEAGVHESKPSKDLEVHGIPVRGEVDAGGGFLRFGMRFGIS